MSKEEFEKKVLYYRDGFYNEYLKLFKIREETVPGIDNLIITINKDIETAKRFIEDMLSNPKWFTDAENKGAFLSEQMTIVFLEEKLKEIRSKYHLLHGETQLIKFNGIDFKQQKQVISLIHNALNEKHFNISYTEFERHFIDNGEAFMKITWTSGEPEITHLFNALIKNVIVTRSQYKLITEHFVKENGEPFDNKQLGVAFQKALVLEAYPIINSLIKKINLLVQS